MSWAKDKTFSKIHIETLRLYIPVYTTFMLSPRNNYYFLLPFSSISWTFVKTFWFNTHEYTI